MLGLLNENSPGAQNIPSASKITSCHDKEDSVPSSGNSPAASPSVSGQAFFISDGEPISHFEYFQPLFEGLGYSFPPFALPLWIALAFAHIQSFIYCMTHKFFPHNPLVTPAEAYKSGVTHYCSCQKAVDAFGYSPTRPNDLRQVEEYYQERGCASKKDAFSLLPVLLCFLVLGVIYLSEPLNTHYDFHCLERLESLTVGEDNNICHKHVTDVVEQVTIPVTGQNISSHWQTM